MFLVFKTNGTKDIFQKHGLKYVLGIGIIFQMYHAEPPNGVGISFDGSDRLLLAPHNGSLYIFYLPRLPREQFPRPRPHPRPWL